MAKLFFTNRNGNTLMKEFTGILTHNPTLEQFDAVVGFLRASGYFALRPLLDNINKARILIGIDVDKYIVRANKSGKLFFGAEEEVREEYLQMLLKDIEKSHYSIEVENGIKQMVQDMVNLNFAPTLARKFMLRYIYSIQRSSTAIPQESSLLVQATLVEMGLELVQKSNMNLM